MNCPKCHSENREGVKFCEECGAKMEIQCPSCAAFIPIEKKFCGECGQNLTLPSEPPPKDLSFDEKIDKIQRYLPKGLTEKILSQRDKIEGERKQVTVMFCDMEGFTQLTERLGPEEAYNIMDRVYEILIHKVHEYEGTVNEMTGDGIMALFGAPVAVEDAPQRGIRSALAIHREMAKFSDKLQAERQTPPIRMRIGIHTGLVVVGTLGNDLRVEFKAVGDTVNLASRMEGLAEPGSTYLTEDTFRLTEGLFRYEALGQKQVKGREEPVTVYRVIAPSTRRTRFDVNAERGLTSFVGRERELELLIDGFERSKSGRGQAVSIVAEAGVGKSRLLYEFRKAVTNEDVNFLEGKCLSYSRGVPYHPVIDILKSNFDVREDDGDSEIRQKIKRQLKILGTDDASTLPYLLELLSVKERGIEKIPISPEAKKDRIMEAVKRITLKGSEMRPVVIAIEDLHWIDKSSEEYLKYLLESISGARVFLIFTYRPEFVHTWGGRSYHSQVTLNRLSNRESLTMVTSLLNTEGMDSDLEDLILAKTEGVPFFIEEFVTSLKDLKIIERKDNKYHLAKDLRAGTIPSTVQDVIMARVDSLPEGAKEVLQTGSVIEREFSYALIKRVKGLPEQELLSHLSVLRDSELLYERGIYPESSYIFKHALTREAVYDSILVKRRKKLHEIVADSIEELFKENIEEHYGVLAEHFVESENYEKGAAYLRLIGNKALKIASPYNAIPYAQKRIACLAKLPQTDDVQKKMIDARTILGLYYTQMNYHIKAKEAVDPIIDLALKRNYKKRLSQIYSVIGAYDYLVEEDFKKAFTHLQEALRVSKESDDRASFSQANYWTGLAFCFCCEFEKAFYHLKNVLDVNIAANVLWGISSMKSILSYFVYYFQGKMDLCFEYSKEALQKGEKSGDLYSKIQAYVSHGTACFGKGQSEEAKRYLLKGIEFSERGNIFSFNAMAQTGLGELYFEEGEYQKSKDHYERSAHLQEQNRLMPSWMNLNRIGVEKAKIMNNANGTNLDLLYDYVYKNKIGICDSWMRRYVAEILLNIDAHHRSEAEDWIKKAIEANKKNGAMLELSRTYTLYAELFKRKGNQPKAKENLRKAIELFKECGADGWVEKAKKELTSLS